MSSAARDAWRFLRAATRPMNVLRSVHCERRCAVRVRCCRAPLHRPRIGDCGALWDGRLGVRRENNGDRLDDALREINVEKLLERSRRRKG